MVIIRCLFIILDFNMWTVPTKGSLFVILLWILLLLLNNSVNRHSHYIVLYHKTNLQFVLENNQVYM